jgi:rhamnosyltransferase
MKETRQVEVAVLLASYNGAKFIEQQITSLAQNTTQFTLHWLDDHSTDNTREVARAATLSAGVRLREWHQTEHQGVPGAFFQLLERVDADIYLFCDQDDIWQAGKIDAAVASLLPDIAAPVLCLSDYWMFKDERPGLLWRSSEVLGAMTEIALQDSRLFMAGIADGHTQAFTRPLRDIFMTHREKARAHAAMHDAWMYSIAVASGTIRILPNVPTTLYRWHQSNTSSALYSWRGRGTGHISVSLRQHQSLRRAVSRHADGFARVSATLPPGPRLEKALSIAMLVSKLGQRQSPLAFFRLMRLGAIWPSRRLAFGLAVVCLCSDAYRDFPSMRHKNTKAEFCGTDQDPQGASDSAHHRT